MKNIPDRIWLQTGGSENADFDDCKRNVTWCQDETHKGDTQYIKMTEFKKELVHFLDIIREYESEAGKSIAQDERESIEFVEIYFSTEAAKDSQ